MINASAKRQLPWPVGQFLLGAAGSGNSFASACAKGAAMLAHTHTLPAMSLFCSYKSLSLKGKILDYSAFHNPRRACAARVTVVGLCVCVRGPHLRLVQLSGKVGILAVSV